MTYDQLMTGRIDAPRPNATVWAQLEREAREGTRSTPRLPRLTFLETRTAEDAR